ncbi:hydrophobin precursor [Lecanosticta acicola]|uniref:Hydrophobin n=1 Tax=Lecanosticta acicola TaxID=111012 RepID=A0AAI9EA30_9PEZI|nr:hydrophobin precursor [Lecanosticta acicola]
MQYQILALAFAALAVAAPSSAPSYGSSGSTTTTSVAVCTSGWTPQCCATNVLGVASLDCSDVPSTITGKDQFDSQCSADGLTASCCLLPILGQGVICQTL